MNDKELFELYLNAGQASDTQVVAVRAVFNAGLMRAAEIARSMDGNEANGYYGQACHEVASACETEATEAGKL